MERRINTAELNSDLRPLILEKAQTTLGKVLIGLEEEAAKIAIPKK